MGRKWEKEDFYCCMAWTAKHPSRWNELTDMPGINLTKHLKPEAIILY